MEVIIKVIDDKNGIYEGTFTLTKGKHKHKRGKALTITKKEGKEIKPSDVIQEQLYRKNFFKSHKTFPEVEKKLNEAGYNFKKGSILMALKGAKYLIKIGRKGSYKFVQKHPPQI
jgi:hypothetical protein